MKSNTINQLPLIMIGAGGHALVLLALAIAAGYKITGVCDPHLADQDESYWWGIPVLGGDEALVQIDPATIGLINGVGQLVRSRARQNIYERLGSAGFLFPAMVHPTAWIAPGVKLANGSQIMAGAIVQPGCCVGENSIINTRASVDHECHIGSHVHIAPGATICGNVRIHDQVYVGAGATIIQGLSIKKGAVIGAGTTIVRDIEDSQLVRGMGSCSRHIDND